VVRNGVVFTPADIKGLLAEIYMYTDTEFLGGIDAVIHPAVFHISMTNWLGRGAYPVGMEAAVGEVVVNYPIYGYKSSVTKRNDREAEVKMTVTYAMNTNGEAIRSPRIAKNMYFHYLLDVDQSENIVGGRYFGDSARIDMLWAPLQPIQGGKRGNERGNPHIDVKTVLAIWRESVPEDLRQKWLNIDPTEEDRLLPAQEAVATAPTAEATPAAAPTDPPAVPPAPATETSPAAAPAPAAETSPAAAPAPAPATEAPAASTPADGISAAPTP
jgi:hypothetical protein